MVVGFNHNFRYKGEVYHIQTEDSGIQKPNIVTLLYQGGTILASKKTSYADITRIDNLEQVVEELMKEQHKTMLRSLKAGEFDAAIDRYQAGRRGVPEPSPESPVIAAAAPPSVEPAAQRPAEPMAVPRVASPEGNKADPPHPRAAKPATGPGRTPAVDISLDEVILSYLVGEDK